MIQPQKLNRKAIIKCFPLLKEKTWEYLWKSEKSNGLFDCRVKGANSFAYYDIELLKKWLCELGYYTPADFSAGQNSAGVWGGLVIHKHRLAG